MSEVEKLQTHVDELQEKVKELRREMSAAISQIVSIKSQGIVKAVLEQFGIKGKEAVLSWQFYPEGDDEGGTYYYPENLKLVVDGEEIDMYDHIASRKSKWSNTYFEDDLNEAIREDFLDQDMNNRLYSDGVEELVINISDDVEEN